ncbi:alpha/beta hydrolase [Streptomyces spiramenti]|uniref:Alpha/beta hydrolase n=1 Tax=Streptomyces spiramenti TaxID=2720606 RepID=A0ABX1AR45_9ACTN|nr:alpha/beta hydrolase [Streptomyces spiramenti]NJP66917.1 alpha/beta hydrolase [Streptomyces spiramenti]
MRTHNRATKQRKGLAPAIAIAASAAFLVAGCASTAPPDEDGPTEDLQSYLEQDIDWAGCSGSATNTIDEELFANPELQCATIEVPVDYDKPDGNTAQIALLRLPASGEADGSLLINPGGPAGAGTSFVAANLPLWQDSPVAERFDIVGFDPRGVGGSTPSLDCYSDEEYDAGETPGFGAVYDITTAAQAEELADRCVEGSGGVENLINAGSVNVVRDMDVMREVLGDEKLTFLGYSYGSELGAMYAETYPEKIRAMAIDGAVDPTLSPTEHRVSQYVAVQQRFDELAVMCSETPDCVLGADPADANDRLHDVLEPLIDTPAVSSDGREVTIWDAYLGINAGLYSEASWPTIISALGALDKGESDEILALRDSFYGRTAAGEHTIDLDTNIAVRCMDWPRLSPEEQTTAARELGEIAPMFDLDELTSGTFRDECEAWPAPPSRDQPWVTPTSDLPETLVVATTGDPGTPYTGGITLAETLGSSLLTVEGKQHGTYLIAGSECVNDIVEAYLLDLETPPEGARCAL